VRLLLEYRKHEFDAPCRAIRDGLVSVVPSSALSLLSWHELEERVCGRPTLDVELLRRTATYEGCSAQDQHIKARLPLLRRLASPR
jgi:hypothetical protein